MAGGDGEHAEVLVGTVVHHIAVGLAALHLVVVRGTRPQSLFIELQVLGTHATQECSTQLTVTDGQGIFHPGIVRWGVLFPFGTDTKEAARLCPRHFIVP